MRFVLIAVGVVLALVSGTLMSPVAREAGRRSGRSFESVGFARAASATEELASRFPWPATTAFQTTHQRSSGAEPIRLVRGRAAWWSEPDPRREELPDVVWGLRRGVGEKAIVFSWIPGSPHGGSLEGLPEFHTAEWFKSLGQPFVHSAGSSNFEFVPANHASAVTLDPRAWQDWTYTTTLLAMDRPLYETLSRSPSADPEADWKANGARVEKVTRAMKQGGDAGLAAIRAVLAENVPLNDHGWAEVATFAQKQGASDLAVNIRSRHLPVGRCSMDLGPQEAARQYAELCFAAGKLSCFLNLQIQIMGDQFQRVAYSSYGEAAHATEAGRLRDIGIDVEKFLRGLLYQFDAPGIERRELDAWRLARSILEANLDSQMGSVLRAEVARPDLDQFNRLRAAQTLAYLRYQKGSPGRTGVWNAAEDKVRPRLISAIRAELATLGLPEPAASWARAFGEE